MIEQGGDHEICTSLYILFSHVGIYNAADSQEIVRVIAGFEFVHLFKDLICSWSPVGKFHQRNAAFKNSFHDIDGCLRVRMVKQRQDSGGSYYLTKVSRLWI